MSFFDYFRSVPESATLAKDRLSIIVARERAAPAPARRLPAAAAAGAAGCHRALREDRPVERHREHRRSGGSEVLEINIVLPDAAQAKALKLAATASASPS